MQQLERERATGDLIEIDDEKVESLERLSESDGAMQEIAETLLQFVE